MEESLKLIEKYLACYHPERRVRPQDDESKRRVWLRSSEPLDRVLSPSCDAAVTPLDKDFAMTKFSFTAHPVFGSLTPAGLHYLN